MYPASDVLATREMGRPIRLTRVAYLRHVAETRADEIKRACDLFAEMVQGTVRKVPGADTTTRMAERIGFGLTPEQAAAREYLYRWNLALVPSPRNAGIFGVIHPLGQ